VVAIDPPGWRPALTHATVLAWGRAEVHFARQIHEREYRLRDPLAALYRALRDAGGASGEPLAELLRGPDRPRSAALAGRLLRVLAELDLVALDVAGRGVRVPTAQRTDLERSSAYRAYTGRLEEGLRWLSERPATATPRAA
jgi:single-stranded-DNA-specific exonuclease